MKAFLIAVFILASLLSVAQEKQICGFVYDGKNLVSIGAEILLNETNQKYAHVSTFTDENGFFCLQFWPERSYVLEVSQLGYERLVVDLNTPISDTLEIVLKENKTELTTPIPCFPIIQKSFQEANAPFGKTEYYQQMKPEQ